MNCVSGDPMESLLYQIFVSLDERTPVNELSTVLQVGFHSRPEGQAYSYLSHHRIFTNHLTRSSNGE